jgi:hypothetical protein
MTTTNRMAMVVTFEPVPVPEGPVPEEYWEDVERMRDYAMSLGLPVASRESLGLPEKPGAR